MMYIIRNCPKGVWNYYFVNKIGKVDWIAYIFTKAFMSNKFKPFVLTMVDIFTFVFCNGDDDNDNDALFTCISFLFKFFYCCLCFLIRMLIVCEVSVAVDHHHHNQEASFSSCTNA